MKRNLLCAMILLSINTTLIYASKKVIVNGYYLNNNNDTIKVTYQISTLYYGTEPNIEYLQRSIAIIDSNKKKLILYPALANQISFEFENRWFTMYAKCYNPIEGYTSNTIFLHRKILGKISMYVRYHTEQTGGFSNAGGVMVPTGNGSIVEEDYLLQKNNDKLVEVKMLTFKKDMTQYFSDCNSVIQKIDDKIYKYEDIDKVIEEYNENCK